MRVPFGTDPRQQEPLDKANEDSGSVPRDPGRFVFGGAGGPQSSGDPGGTWCCRQGGTKPPTSPHNCCPGLRTNDELLPDSDDKPANTIKTEAEHPDDTMAKDEKDFLDRFVAFKCINLKLEWHLINKILRIMCLLLKQNLLILY